MSARPGWKTQLVFVISVLSAVSGLVAVAYQGRSARPSGTSEVRPRSVAPSDESVVSPPKGAQFGPEANQTAVTSPTKPSVYDPGTIERDPEYIRLTHQLHRPSVESAFGPLVARLELDERRREELMHLLIERSITQVEAQNIARREGIDSAAPLELQKFIDQLTEPAEAAIRAFLDPVQYEMYSRYVSSPRVRAVVNRFAASMYLSADSLSQDQIEELVDVASRTGVPNTRGAAWALTEATEAEMSSRLSPEQLQALRLYREHLDALSAMYDLATSRQEGEATKAQQ